MIGLLLSATPAVSWTAITLVAVTALLVKAAPAPPAISS